MDVPSVVRLKTNNFPGWIARIDGRSEAISSDNDGVQVLLVQPGVHQIEVLFVSTRPRTLGAALSSVGFMTMAGLIGFEYIKARAK